MLYSSVKTVVPGTIVDMMSGAIVTCWTLGNIWMTTSPERWIMPKIGGFSFSSVPRPRAPFKRLRRPLRFFFLTATGFPLWPAITYTSSHSTLPVSLTSGFFLLPHPLGAEWPSGEHRFHSDPTPWQFACLTDSNP